MWAILFPLLVGYMNEGTGWLACLASRASARIGFREEAFTIVKCLELVRSALLAPIEDQLMSKEALALIIARFCHCLT